MQYVYLFLAILCACRE